MPFSARAVPRQMVYLYMMAFFYFTTYIMPPAQRNERGSFEQLLKSFLTPQTQKLQCKHFLNEVLHL